MNYTTNYHLPQWAETDRIMMEDFNQMCSDIDEGIKTAQDTAETAQANASAAQTAADAVADAYTPDNKPYVIGTYTGNGYGTQEITLGFSPSITIISGEVYTTADDPGMQHTVIATSSSPNMVYDTTATGFSVHKVGDYKPRLNVDGQRYRYIAFR